MHFTVGNFISMKKGVLEKINKIKIMAMIKKKSSVFCFWVVCRLAENTQYNMKNLPNF